MKPTLLVLAAGMGSRYGGLKQMDGVGPNGEIIMDYSINDAIRAGFGKVVFVIRHSFEEEFKRHINADHFGGRIAVEYVYQELDCLPAGFSVPEGREKPWGTNHAILMAKDVIHEPFAIINADDFYGRDAFEVMARHLNTLDGAEGKYCMVGYRLENTLSENGTVSRGVCETDANGLLVGMTERTSIGRTANGIEYKDAPFGSRCHGEHESLRLYSRLLCQERGAVCRLPEGARNRDEIGILYSLRCKHFHS